MNINWRRINKTLYRLDDTWCVHQESGEWRVYRDGRALLQSHRLVEDGMAEAEELRAEERG